MGRLSRSPYQKAKLVSGDESLFRLRDHSEWGRRRSHEFYEYITSTSEYVVGPKSACTTCNSETFERWEGCTSGRKLKSSIKNCTGREIRVYTWGNTRHKSTFHRRATEADQRPPADIVPTWFKMCSRFFFRSVFECFAVGIVSQNWGNISKNLICNSCAIHWDKIIRIKSFFEPVGALSSPISRE